MAKELPYEIIERASKWLEPPYDEETRIEVEKLLQHDPDNLINAFYKVISFGTGGLRGLMGVGTNRINRYTIGRATQGLANYILKQQTKNKHRVFIGYDCRRHSREFAEETACVLAANGIETFITKELRPTPFVSFGCRRHACTAAVMITASHNPPEYNGYKVYWSDGGQVVPPHDTGILEEVKKIDDQNAVKLVDFSHPLIHEVSRADDEAYLKELSALQNFPEDNKNLGPKLHIIYSSLHGAGITLMPEALKRWGFTSLSFVKDQTIPDGNFPSAPSPNPEQQGALQQGIDQMLQENASLFFATDPDADRLGVVVSHQGKAVILNGNQIGAICTYYLCLTLSKLGKMPENGAFITTIVTTELIPLIASAFNKASFKVLTGFKYIGEKIHEWEQSHDGFKFIFGAEESLGFLYGTHSRDKDAIIAACLLAEIALQQKKHQKTLVDFLREIYERFGFFQEKQLSLSFGNGEKGEKTMKAIMEKLRTYPPKEICKKTVVVIEDYQTGVKTHFPSNKKEKLNLPKSNVLVFILEDEGKFVIRPSGTEPKIKIYGMVREKISGDFDAASHACNRHLDMILKTLKEDYLTV